MKTVYYVDMDFSEELVEGKEYILVCHVPEVGKDWYSLMPDNGEGIPGNLDSSVKKYHGWRGTTNNTAIYGEGLHRLDKIESEKMTDTSMRYKVRLSADLKPEDA